MSQSLNIMPEQEERLTDVSDLSLIRKYKNVNVRITKTVRGNLFGNEFDLHNNDRGILLGSIKKTPNGRFHFIVVQIRFRNVRRFSGDCWVPITHFEMLD